MSNHLEKQTRPLKMQSLPFQKVMYHGHCHEKAFGLASRIETVLEKIPNLKFEQVPGGCCGMAGSFGYEKEHYEISKKIGDVGPLPHIRDVEKNVIIVANGTSCRHQFNDLTENKAIHMARLINMTLDASQN